MNKNFLSKKSWHTGSLKHIEKVWKAERRDGDEKKKMDLLKRELAEENRHYELTKMKETALGKPDVDRVDWMYSVKKGPSADEYLVGSASVRQREEDKELEQLSKKPGALWLNQTNVKFDHQQKIRDDPLLMIKQQESRSLKKILDNPLQMKKIKESKSMKKMLKKIKKEKKKLKKDSDSSSSDSDESPQRTRKRERSPDSDKDERRSRDSNKKPRSRSSSPKDDRRAKRDTKERSRSRSRSPRRRDDDRQRNDERSRDDRRVNDYRRDTRKPKLSEEERKKKREEMEMNAKINDMARFKKLTSIKAEEQRVGDGSENKHHKFIDELNAKIYTRSEETLEDRMRRNIHTLERNSGTALIHEEGGILK